MKKLLIALLSLGCLHASAQIDTNPGLRKKRKLSEEDLSELKKTTTLFILQERDFDNIKEWEDAISKAWDVTPHKIIHAYEVPDYTKKRGYSIFGIEKDVDEVTYTRSNTYSTTGMGNRATQRTYTSTHSYLITNLVYTLYTPSYDKKGVLKANKDGDLWDKNYYANILLYGDAEAMRAAKTTDNRNLHLLSWLQKPDEDFQKIAYTQAVMHNWTPGMMRSYLAVVSKSLKANALLDRDDEFENTDPLHSLKTDTLYVPDYVNIRVNLVGEEKEVDRDDDDIKDAYKHPIRFVSTEELDKLIADNTRSIHYLSVAISGGRRKYITVHESGSGKIIYANHVLGSRGFKNKDLSRLSKFIK